MRRIILVLLLVSVMTIPLGCSTNIPENKEENDINQVPTENWEGAIEVVRHDVAVKTFEGDYTIDIKSTGTFTFSTVGW